MIKPQFTKQTSKLMGMSVHYVCFTTNIFGQMMNLKSLEVLEGARLAKEVFK